jgi:hypothetical protein
MLFFLCYSVSILVLFCNEAAKSLLPSHKKQEVLEDPEPILFDVFSTCYFMFIATVISITETIGAYPDKYRMLANLSSIGFVPSVWCLRATQFETDANKLRMYEVGQTVFSSIGVLVFFFEILIPFLPIHVNIAISTVLSIFVEVGIRTCFILI